MKSRDRKTHFVTTIKKKFSRSAVGRVINYREISGLRNDETVHSVDDIQWLTYVFLCVFRLQNTRPLWSTSFTCVRIICRTKNITMDTIVIQWYVNKRPGIQKFSQFGLRFVVL